MIGISKAYFSPFPARGKERTEESKSISTQQPSPQATFKITEAYRRPWWSSSARRRRFARIRCYPLSLMRRRLPWWRLSDFRWAFKGVRASGDLLGIACDLLSLLPVFVFAVSATGQHNFSVARAAAPSQWNATRPRRKAAGTRNGAPSNTARRRLARSSFRYRVVIALRYRRSARFRAAHWSKPFLITGNFFHSNRRLLSIANFTDLRSNACDPDRILFPIDRDHHRSRSFFFFFFLLYPSIKRDNGKWKWRVTVFFGNFFSTFFSKRKCRQGTKRLLEFLFRLSITLIPFNRVISNYSCNCNCIVIVTCYVTIILTHIVAHFFFLLHSFFFLFFADNSPLIFRNFSYARAFF